MRWLAAVLALFLLWPSEDGDAWRLMAGGAATAPPAYTGPCDIVTGGCAIAHSVTRSMRAAYAGPLFQIVRLSDNATLDIPQSNHVADISGVPAFCSGTNCRFFALYDHSGNTNTMLPSLATQGGLIPAVCGSSHLNCAPLFWIDPAHGLPIVLTVWPYQFSLDTSSGLTGGSHAYSVLWHAPSYFQSSASMGPYGFSHQANVTDTLGSSFVPGYEYNNGSVISPGCGTFTLCLVVAYELDGDQASTEVTARNDTTAMGTYDGSVANGGTNHAAGYYNGTQLWSGTPPGFTHGSNVTLNVPTSLSVGGGGDNGHVDSGFREGIMTNSAISAGDYAAIKANMDTFYAAHTAPACNGTAHMGFYWYPETQGSSSLSNKIPLDRTWLGYGLYQMRPDYYGNIATLKDAVGTSQTFAVSTTGNCQMDAAAATFCAAHSPCTVTKLFYQGSFSHDGTTSPIPDPTFDIGTIIFSGGPRVDFANLNGLPTMHFSGAQSMCSSSISSPAIVGDHPLTFAAIARRTVTSGNMVAFGSFAGLPDNYVGFAAGADTAQMEINAGATPEAATDNHWHSLVWESSSTTAALPYVDGVAGTAISFSASSAVQTLLCMGGKTGGTLNFTGDIAEMSITNSRASGASNFATVVPALIAVEEATWGTLPN